MSGCPSDEVMAALTEGNLDAATAAGVHEHIDSCQSCQRLLRELATGDSPKASERSEPWSEGVWSNATPTGQGGESPTPLDPRSGPSSGPMGGPKGRPRLPTPLPTAPELIQRRTRAASYRPGAIVGERYKLGRLLGSGGMGTVWAALHLGTDRPVALKILRGDHRSTPAARLRFLREARVLGRIDHPNLVPVRDVFEDREAPVLVMDLLEGESLAERLGRKGRLPLDEVARLLPGALSAISTAHDANIIHRDLKPDNLFVVPESRGGESLRVLDFGIAKLIDDEDPSAVVITGKGEVLGTPPYMAPEQLRGEPEIDRRVDVWALGVILYELLAGRRPFTGDKFAQFHQRVTSGQRDPLALAAPDLPRDVTALVEKMLTVDVEKRCPDLKEAIEVLGRYAWPGAESGRVRGARRRKSWLLAAAGLVVLAVLVTAGVGLSTMNFRWHKLRVAIAYMLMRQPTVPAPPTAAAATGPATGPAMGAATGSAPPAAHASATPCEIEWGETLAAFLCRSPVLAMREAAYRTWRDLRMASSTDDEKALLQHERKILEWALNACGGAEPCLLRRLQGAAPRVGVIDCARAVSQDALTICHNPSLATLEGTLAAYYRMDRDHYGVYQRQLRRLPGGGFSVLDLRGGSPHPVPAPAGLSSDQTAWLVDRHRCGSSEPCLSRALGERIKALRAIHVAFAGDEPHAP